MVYEIGSEAFDLMQPASDTKIFSFQRPYTYVLVFNLRQPDLKKAEFRRALNNSIDRDAFVSKALDGHGRPANSPVWPEHWASSTRSPRFQYSPSNLATESGRAPITLLYSQYLSHERMALFVQQQLQAVGVAVRLELSSVDEAMSRAAAGKFDMWLVDMGLGPNFLRQYLFWHSGSPYNWGNYSNPRVDVALD